MEVFMGSDGVTRIAPEYKTEVWFYTEEEQTEFENELKGMGKYRWHDLRKNPDDLPESGIVVLVYHKYWHYKAEAMFGEYEPAYYIGDRWTGEGAQGKDNEIIAWKYIELFKE